MPPSKTKQTKGNPAKKEQIAEKVKEIQQRQKNWLRQRDEHLKSSSEPVSRDSTADREHSSSPGTKNANKRDSVEHTAQGADILRVHHDSSQELATQVSDKLNVKVKHGFGAWLQSRKHADDDNTNQSLPNTQGNNKDCLPGIYDGSSHFRDERPPAPLSSSGVSHPRNSSRTFPLSPAEFDSLADSIASRVKKDLGIKHSNGARLHNAGETVDDGFRRAETFVQGSAPERIGHKAGGSDGIGNDDRASVDVSCHRCPFCSSLMSTSAHAPMLLVPCGHTVCKRCSSSHASCRLCGTHVGSLTTNIMLHQIIQEFHGKGRQGTADTCPLPAKAQVTWDRGDKASPAVPPKTTTKYCDVDYSSQLRGLHERQETLQGEARSCRGEKDRIVSKVKRAEKQVKAIEKEEASLERQIQQLQEQLQGLRQHKEEYTEEYQQLQEQLKSASDQVTLVERTLKSLEDEIDKVQFLAEGQGDTYLHRQSQYR